MYFIITFFMRSYVMKTSEVVKLSIKNNIPMLITGDTGSGKSSIVKTVAQELGYDLYDLRLAGILPEDIGGLPRPQGDYYEYLMPKWFKERLGKPFVLFLDEINQASIQVLHALYGVVLDRMVAGVKNPEMRIIAACNDFKENEYVTDLMKPLRARFPIDIVHEPDKQEVKNVLLRKYPQHEEIIDIVQKSGKNISPRELEFGLSMIDAGLVDIKILQKCFYELTSNVIKKIYVKRNELSEDSENAKIKDAVNKIKVGSVMFGGVSIPIDKQAILDGLSEEGKQTVNALTGVA